MPLKRRPRWISHDKCEIFVLFFFLHPSEGRRPRLHRAQVWSSASAQEDTCRHASVTKACGSMEIIRGASVRLMAPPGHIQWPRGLSWRDVSVAPPSSHLPPKSQITNSWRLNKKIFWYLETQASIESSKYQCHQKSSLKYYFHYVSDTSTAASLDSLFYNAFCCSRLQCFYFSVQILSFKTLNGLSRFYFDAKTDVFIVFKWDYNKM